LQHRHDEIRRRIGNDPIVAAESAADLDARAEPIDRKVFGEATDLGREFDVAETVQLDIAERTCVPL
jgi:hypothetical protein